METTRIIVIKINNMKTKLNNIYIIILFFSTSVTLGQENCSFDTSDLTIELNGWDIDRTDYTHENFLNCTGLQNKSQFDNPQLDYSGEKDTAEFGYPWYYYYSGTNFIHFAGVVESSGNYNGLKRINNFVIRERGVFNLNGIQVGDSLADLEQEFSGVNFCTKTIDSSKKALFIRYEYFTLGFLISSADDTIQEIELYSPI